MAPILHTLLDELAELRRSCARTRFRIALAVLHTSTVGQFVTELIDQVPGSEEARPAIADLCRALDEGMALTARQMETNASLAAAAADEIGILRDILELPQTMIRAWLAKADLDEDSAAALADAVRTQIDRTQTDIDLLGTLAGECRRIAVPLDASVVASQLERLRDRGVPTQR